MLSEREWDEQDSSNYSTKREGSLTSDPQVVLSFLERPNCIISPRVVPKGHEMVRVEIEVEFMDSRLLSVHA